jgi:hypothetical protein
MRLAMDTLEDRIRRRAYELWEAAGQTGAPEDHWLEAERELQSSQDHPDATFTDAPCVRRLAQRPFRRARIGRIISQVRS